MSPPQLAAELDMSPKTLRGWLRRNFPRENFMLGSSGELTPAMVSAVRAHFGGRDMRLRAAMPESTSTVATSIVCSPDGEQGNGLHHRFMSLANNAGVELRLGTKVPGLTTRGHVMDHVLYGVPAGAVESLRAIFEALGGDAGIIEKKRVNLIDPDLVHPATGTLVEVDELQHFTSARRTTLRLYPRTVSLGFDLDEYVALVEHWRTEGDRAFAHKTAPEFPGEAGRQRQRAFLDAARDLLAPHLTRRPVIRIPAPNRSLEGAMDRLRARLSQVSCAGGV